MLFKIKVGLVKLKEGRKKIINIYCLLSKKIKNFLIKQTIFIEICFLRFEHILVVCFLLSRVIKIKKEDSKQTSNNIKAKYQSKQINQRIRIFVFFLVDSSQHNLNFKLSSLKKVHTEHFFIENTRQATINSLQKNSTQFTQSIIREFYYTDLYEFMSSPKNTKQEEMSPSSKTLLDIEETMPQSINKIHNIDGSNTQNQAHNSQFSKSTSISNTDSIMEGEAVPSKAQKDSQEQVVTKIPENKCKVKGHKNEDLSYICTIKGCDEILLCKKCKRKHSKDHQSSIKLLDDWFNNMFGRRVEDSDNNKVSRKCGMNLGKLQDQLKTLQSEIEARKQTIEKQTQQFIEMITTYIKKKHSECIKRLDGHYQMKTQLLEEYQQTYKKLKGLNRFTILENLKRQHNPNSDQPPLIPIQSILKFLLENEQQYTDSSQIENQHKGFSKLIRDTESFEQQISNETKQFQKLSSTDEGKPDYLIRDSPVIQRIQDYIDFLYFFEKGIPKKTQSFFRSGTLNFDEEDYQQQLNQQSGINNPTSAAGITSVNMSFSNQCQRMQLKPNMSFKNQTFVSGDSTGRRRLTAEEVLKFSSSRQQLQGNILKQIQQQDEGDFIIQKQKEQKLQSSGNNEEEDEEKEEIEYECLVQENFNNAQFIDFKNDSIRVYGDSSLQLYDINGGLFNKKENFKAQQQIISGDQEMYEIGALEEVQFYQIEVSQNGLLQQQQKYSNQSLVDSQKTGQMLIEDINLMDLNQNPNFVNNNQQKKQLPILIIGLKSDPAKIEIWDMDRNEKIVQQMQAHDCSITCIQVLEVIPNKSILFAVGSYDGIIKTWLFSCTQPDANGLVLEGNQQIQFDKKQCVYTLTQQLTMKSHSDFVTCMIIFRIKDDPLKEYLISAGSDKKIILWDWKSNQTEQGQSEGAAPNNTLQSQENISTERQGMPSNSNTDTEPKQEETKKKPMFLKNKIKISSLKSSSSQVNSSNKENQNSLAANLNDKLKKPLKIMNSAHLDKINCLEKLDEGFLATGSSDNTIKIWDMDTQSEQKVLQNKYIVNNICRLKRGTLVCSANNVKMSIYLINIWNWELGQIIGTIKGHTNRITKIQVIPSIFEGSPSDPFYNKIVTCERNKVIRVWRQSNVDSDYGRRMNSQEDEINTSPSSIRSYRGYSYPYRNPAEEFLNYYHLEMDPSLTPKLNMARVVSQTAIPSGSYDKTPISNLLRGPNFNGQTTPSNSNLYFTSQQNSQGVRHQQYPSFSQQNNLLQQQYMSLTQQVQQVNSIQSMVRQQGTNFTPPKINQVFQFSPDDQNLVSFSPLITSAQINNLNSPQLQKPQTPLVSPLQLSSQYVHQQLQGNINQGIPFVSAAVDQINGPVCNNCNGVNNLFQQQTNMNNDLQQAIDQTIIQNVNINNSQTSFESEQKNQNLAPNLDLNIDQQKQQSILEQALKEQKQRLRTYSEVGNMLAPLEEANESEYNSPIDSQSNINHSQENVVSFSIDNSKLKYSRENSKEMQETSIYQASPASKYYEKENGLSNEDQKIFKNCGPFSQIPERSPGSETSSSSGGNLSDQIQLNKEGSNNFQSDFVVQQQLKKSLSASPNAPDQLRLDFCSDQSTNDSAKDTSDKKEQKKPQISYQIKLNGVQKYGSLEVNGTNYDLEDTKQNSANNNNIQIEFVSPQTNNSNTQEIKNSNKNQENVNQQNLQNENHEQQKQEQQDNTSNQLLPPEEKKQINYSQSAPSSPSLPSSNPLLKSKAAMLQKTKKSSRNIFQN
ncbi:WD domain, G-beta repeat protein (macronuclear) [Tetrahymena thermophila SB210]|uniref:WD domain, G-beta repeat protein n=1 Tax=Tetrahymena thermophila (strain SB210) TaxID=312017 RepID=A4VDH6_TETTS|nr:WD domain, G-beta repeat protein [Tetrahymena thermophila SB210]EDK31576.2 WD domain, G-beta repeat protein [Tetrahymena thermophila SB210]|eukprot:XP_001471416.2 WD domain, G-beta repeat protein [Tetrahymena thermophila SB210]